MTERDHRTGHSHMWKLVAALVGASLLANAITLLVIWDGGDRVRDDDALLAHRLELLEAEAHRISERCIEIERLARPAQEDQVREPATQPDDSAADALRHIERRMHALEETLARVHDELNAARVPRERSEEPRDLAELRVLAASLQQQLVDRQLAPHVRVESLELLLALPAEARGVAIDLATHALDFAIEQENESRRARVYEFAQRAGCQDERLIAVVERVLAREAGTNAGRELVRVLRPYRDSPAGRQLLERIAATGANDPIRREAQVLLGKR